MKHLSAQELQDYAEGARENEQELHLRMCGECGKRLDSLRALERALRALPSDRPSRNFTANVLQRAGVRESATFAWVMLKNLAPLVALTIVIGIVLAVLTMTGVLQSADVREVPATTKQISGAMASGIHAMNGWMMKYFPFAFAKSTYGLTLFILVFFAAVALIDKHIFMPMMKRKIM
jgi:hypothetical protein